MESVGSDKTLCQGLGSGQLSDRARHENCCEKEFHKMIFYYKYMMTRDYLNTVIFEQVEAQIK